MFIRLFLTVLLCLSCLTAALAKPPAAQSAESAASDFAQRSKEFSDLIAEMTTLRDEYVSATSEAKKGEAKTKYDADREKAKGLVAALISAAEKAYAEKPNADPKVTEVLVGTLSDEVHRDDFEPAFAIGKLLMDNKCRDKNVPGLAGAAAFCVNEYDLASSWLAAAAAAGSLGKKEAHFLDSLDYAKAAWAKEKKIRAAEAKADDLPRVLLKTSKGDIELELFENEAPNTVLNFITLVEKGFYNNVKFHRVLPGFMAQGGDPKGNGTGGPGYTIPDECFRPDHRMHFRGSLSMAHTSQRDSGGSQFFLMFVPREELDGAYTVFGRIIKGFDVLAKLQRVNPDAPTSVAPDKIIEATVIRKRQHPYDAKDVKKSSTHD